MPEQRSHWYISLSSVILLLLEIQGECIHDEIQKLDVPIQDVIYASPPPRIPQHHDSHPRGRRSLDKYQPLRVSVNYDNFFQTELLPEKIELLQRVVRNVVDKISTILSVIPVNGTLLLKREGACFSEWSEGRNMGKCAIYDRKYREETCLNEFKILDNHLDGLFLWDKNGLEPVKQVFEVGQGVSNTDFILYVSAVMTESCQVKQGKRLLAYAAYCQTDQHGRPIAGYVNICPTQLKSENFTEEHLFQTMLHEILHALGFSKALFSKFQQCVEKGNKTVCEKRGDGMFKKVSGVYRMITPSVVREAQRHFECFSEPRYGGPMQVKNSIVQSHWDGLLMFGSLMAPTIGLPDVTALDLITLALFEDSGWYQVNYEQADLYFWGKGEGCQFGLKPFCQESQGYFCDSRKSGCHFLHKHKGTCEVLSDKSHCKVYVAKLDDSCALSGSVSHPESTEELYGTGSMCFMSNLTSEGHVKEGDMAGRCYQHRCRQDRLSEVKVDVSNWTLCPYGEIIKISGFEGFMRCPIHKDIMCPVYIPQVRTDTEVSLEVENKRCWKKLDPNIIQKNFIKDTSRLLNITYGRIKNLNVNTLSSTVTFDLGPTSNPGEVTTVNVLARLSYLSENRQLLVDFSQNCIGVLYVPLSSAGFTPSSVTESTTQMDVKTTVLTNNSNFSTKNQVDLNSVLFSIMYLIVFNLIFIRFFIIV